MLKTKFYLLLLLVLPILASCKEEQKENVLTPKSNLNSKAMNVSSIDWKTYKWQSLAGIDPSNSDNPFDWIGQFHNDGMDYLANHFLSQETHPIGEVFLEQLLNKSTEYDFLIYPDKIEISQEEYKQFTLEKLEDETLLIEYSTNTTYDPVIKQLLDYIAVENPDMSIVETIEYVKEFESKVQNNEFALNEEDTKVVYYFTSTYRFSLAYWNDVHTGLREDYNRHGFSDIGEALPQGLSKSAAKTDAEHAKGNFGKSTPNSKSASYIHEACKRVKDFFGALISISGKMHEKFGKMK